MLGLPSTTEVDRRLPKEAFYRHLRLDARTRRSFVDDIDSIVVTNSVKPSTSGFADGRDVHEILVLAILLKSDRQPTGAIEAIASSNPHRIVFLTEPGSVAYVMRRGLQSSRDIRELALSGETLDDAWDSICSQVAFGDADGRDVDRRLDVARRIAALEAEISELDAKCRKARQINRKNELFAELRARQAELRGLRTGIAIR
jgi:hypothetical protein